MKPVGASPKPAASLTPPQSKESVADQLRAIDTALLDRMLEIREEQTRIDDYRQKAEANKGKVELAVWRRVTDDYRKRYAALEQKVVPLKAQVREEYQKLRTLLDKVTKANDDARLAKQEIEFRHEVGEYDDDQTKEAIEEPDKVLDQCRDDLELIEDLKARFVEAFRPGEDLDQPPAAAASVAEAPAPFEEDATRLLTAEETAQAKRAGADEPQDMDATGDHAMLFPLAALVSDDGALQSEFRLGPVTVIGRLPDAQIQLARPGVSRRHAEISLSTSGFNIKDLGSQNGTLVNGAPITETPLVDGDRIEVGDVQLTFRVPWPAVQG